MSEKTTHVKVARCTIDPNDGVEIIKTLNQGGEAQLWDIKTWEQYHDFLQSNPSARGSMYYPWTFVEYLNPPPFDLAQVKLLPEKTGGSEFKINTNAKN